MSLMDMYFIIFPGFMHLGFWFHFDSFSPFWNTFFFSNCKVVECNPFCSAASQYHIIGLVINTVNDSNRYCPVLLRITKVHLPRITPESMADGFLGLPNRLEIISNLVLEILIFTSLATSRSNSFQQYNSKKIIVS